MDYVCGFLMNWKLDKVALILKKRGPTGVGLEGRWNGIGGRIEEIEVHAPTFDPDINTEKRPEVPHVAMSRKFQEETGVLISPKRWHCFHIVNWAHTKNKVYYFVAFGDEINKVKTTTDEEVKVFDPIDWWDDIKIMYDVSYLLQMLRVHIRAGDLMCLDPENVNAKYKNSSVSYV